MENKVNGLGVADILIIGAELLSEAADVMGEAEASTEVKLKSTGKKYQATLIVSEIEVESE